MLNLKSMAFAALVVLAPQMAAAQANQFTIGTNPVGTAYNAVGTALAQVITKQTGVRTTAQPYTGSSVMAPLVSVNELTIGMTTTFSTGRDFRGENGAPPMQNLRVLARLWTLPYGYMVKKDSGLETLADLKGRKVVVDIRGNSALQATNVALLGAGGLGLDDVNPVTIASLPQGVAAVQDGAADATSVGVPIAVVQQANATIPGGIKFLDVTGPNATQEYLNKVAPGLSMIKLPAGSMAGVDTAITTMGLESVIYASTALSADDAAKILGAIEADWPALQEQFGFFRRKKPADFVHAASMAQPYHDGAVAYYQSKGYWTDEAGAKQDALIAQIK
jgi:TRAP transporter TAXI family solute receptor